MEQIVFHALCLISVLGRSAGGSVPVKGFTGGGIAIFCKFDDQHKGKPKYFCKGDALTCPHNRLTHVNNSRFVQYENVHGDYLTALLTNLTSEDSGTYHCAAEDGHLNTGINLNVKQGDCCDTPITVIGYEGKNVNIHCKFPVESKSNIKHFCKQHENFIETDLIESKPSLTSAKYSLPDHKTENSFTVTIHDLEGKDAGTYWCGVRTGGENIALTTQIDLQITVQVKGFTSGGIVIICKFDDQDQRRQRYFCKGNATTCPSNLVTQDSDSRLYQYRNVLGNYLTVLITNLTSEDAGTYHCAEDGKSLTEVHLSIEEGDCCGQPITVTGDVGGNVTIQCKYPVEFTNNTKHFCRHHKDSIKLDLLETKPLQTNLKYSLSDDKSGNVFTVTIYNLKLKHVGEYWCGVSSGGSSVALITKVELQIPAPAENTKKAPVLLVLVVTALVLVVTLFLCYARRQRRKRDRSNGMTEDHQENPDPDRIYEEIDDISLPLRPLPMTRCTYTTVDNTDDPTYYTTAQLPTIPCDDPTYYTIQSPLDVSGDVGLHLLSMETHTVYTTAQLPTIPCDVPTYLNIQSLTHTSGDTVLNIGTDETNSTVSTVYASAQGPIDPGRGPPQGTDQMDKATHSPTHTSDNTVYSTASDQMDKATHSPTHTSDNTVYSAASDPTNPKMNTVYVTAGFSTHTNEGATDPDVLVPTNPSNDPCDVR